jgi:hypothetical protein
VWEVDPLFCPQCQREMRIVLMINNAQIIDHILRYVGIWVDEVCNHGTRIAPSTGPPGDESVAGSGIQGQGFHCTGSPSEASTRTTEPTSPNGTMNATGMVMRSTSIVAPHLSRP